MGKDLVSCIGACYPLVPCTPTQNLYLKINLIQNRFTALFVFV